MQNLPDLDVAKIADELNIDDNARSQGAKNLPETSQSALSSTEQLILDRINKLNSAGRSIAEETVRTYAQKFAEIDLSLFQRKLTDLPDYILRHVDRVLQEQRPKLIELRKLERRHLSSLNAFEDKHKLDQPAEYPSSKIFHWSIVVAMLLVESIANSYFFAKGSDLGLIGGALQALLISAVNIGVALLAGNYLFRNFHHMSLIRRCVAGLGMAFSSFFVLFFNLATAHYRALLENDPSSALVETIPSLVKSPFGFNNFDAVILLFIGILFAVAAMIKSYKADAFYPGHGIIDRRYKDANDDYKEARDESRKLAHSILDDGAKYADQFQVDAKKAAYQQTVILDQLEQFASEYGRFNNDLKEDQYSLLKIYREKNVKVRSTPQPEYFSKFPEPQTDSGLPVDNLERDRKVASGSDKYLSELEEIASTFSKNLLNLDRSINDEIDAFISNLEQEADLMAREEIKLSDQGH
jgi:hypothetical protein